MINGVESYATQICIHTLDFSLIFAFVGIIECYSLLEPKAVILTKLFEEFRQKMSFQWNF